MYKSVVFTVLLFAFFAQPIFAQPTPNLAGTWKFDPVASTGVPQAKGALLLVISQSGEELTFEYYRDTSAERGEPIQTTYYSTNGRERMGNKVRTYVAYVKSYWERQTLVVRTRAVVDATGEQIFDMEERWMLSKDGNTLTEKSSDGTKAVYTRQPNPEP